MLGFTAATAAAETETERRFEGIPTADGARRQLRTFTAEPHLAGSERNNELARYIADQWREQGLEDVVLHRYDVFSSEPGEISLEMVAPVRYRASLREAAYAQDPDSKNPAISAAWMGMSRSGEITAPVIYAHSGNPADFDLLRRQGIDVKGKIVLVRYSNPYSYRGFKALTAEKAGAAAILIYSDPAEDGNGKGKVFPDGPWGPETHLQRGAIEYDFQQAGDPTTPGWPSIPGAKHIAAEDASPVPKIMALPLSWHDAKPLLQHMDGPVAPADWQGGLPFKYHLGGGRVRAHLKIRMQESIKPNYVVEARIRGSEHPDEWVLVGNHRDAWVFGAADPGSGTASLMETTRGLGTLAKQGVRPKRTLVFLSWDGEETSFSGSAEWSEQFAHELRERAVAYLNVDIGVSGPSFTGSSVGSLAPMLAEASKAIAAPSGRPLYDTWRESRALDLKERGERAPVTDFNLVETRIGSGSDYAALLDHVGIPVIDVSFEGPYGVYHSAYDDFYWMSHFGDPTFEYHAAMARVLGVLALRLADADIVPYDFAGYAMHIRTYLDHLVQASSPSGVDLAPLRAALDSLEQAGRSLDDSVQAALEAATLDRGLADQINRGMMSFERNWLSPAGIPGRPWYQHLIYACRSTYAHLELPGLTEAVEGHDAARAQQQADALAAAVRVNTELVLQLDRQLACAGNISRQGVSLCRNPASAGLSVEGESDRRREPRAHTGSGSTAHPAGR
ncbi:MAG TPA: M28 family metallopeptidase [Steroidobacteraceae bacterium]|jgi:N-acetylated-alpha-linked acidic dipeptidase|nr:M28 family metallopeptidase [Steroidobacteraceae bacterium]